MNFHLYFRIFSFVFVLALGSQKISAHANPQQAPTPTPVPRFQGETLPEPPQQRQVWTVPTGLPANFVSATQTLFEQGLADPRGGEYRSLDIATGSVWGGEGIAHIHGWLIPGDAPQKFAVCWNGLVYPVVTVGSSADLKADALNIVSKDEAERAAYAKTKSPIPFYRFKHALPEAISASEKELLPIKACLLLRLGENDLANRVWTTWIAGMDAKVNNDAQELKDPYLMLATYWTWAMFGRAVCAHMRGDDHLSTLDARNLTVIAPLVESEAGKRGFPKQSSFSDSQTKLPYLNFLTPLPALLKDEERRLITPARPPMPRQATKAQRIAALIDSMDQVQARQWGQPGGVSLGTAPQVEALIAMGDDAVEPLIDALETETRLTRSVQFGRDFFYNRELLGAVQAEYAALTGILKTSSFGHDEASDMAPHTYKSLAAQIRSYWQRYKDVSEEERWYLTLKDDKAGNEAWKQAATNILTPQNVRIVQPSSAIVETITTSVRKGTKPSFRGEVLRAKTKPSVAELLALRADQIGSKTEHSSNDIYTQQDSCDMALYLSSWAPQSAVPALQRATKRYKVMVDHWSSSVYSAHSYMLRLFLARTKGGDATAFADYVSWLHLAKPDEERFHRVEDLTPLRQEPQNAALQEAGKWLFNNTSSPWPRYLQDPWLIDNSFDSPLVKVAGFKEFVLRQMRNTKPFGKVVLHIPTQQRQELDVSVGNMGFYGKVDPDLLKPKPEISSSFRVCDFYAWMLWRKNDAFKKAPRFELYWSQQKRDAVLPHSMAFVRNY